MKKKNSSILIKGTNNSMIELYFSLSIYIFIKTPSKDNRLILYLVNSNNKLIFMFERKVGYNSV